MIKKEVQSVSMHSKFDRQCAIVFEASQFETYDLKIAFLKSIEEFKNLKNSSILDKLRRWTNKVRSEHKSEFRGCTYGNKVDNLLACDIKLLLSTLTNDKKFNCSIINIDVLEKLLLVHCKNNGKVSVFNKMKRCKGWAMEFCRRHSFNRRIITVVGSSRSKANLRQPKPPTKAIYETTLDSHMTWDVQKNSCWEDQIKVMRRQKCENEDCVVGLDLSFTDGYDLVYQSDALNDVAYGMLRLKQIPD
jgi:hypothetical protein